MNTNPLFPASHANVHYCHGGNICPDAVVEINGRFFITASHPAFNDRANNADGYASARLARIDIFQRMVA